MEAARGPSAGWEALDADGVPMQTYCSAPAGRPGPGVVVIMHGWGLDGFVAGMVDRVAAVGFAAAAPDLFCRVGASAGGGPEARIAQLRDDQVARDVNVAVDFLRRRGSRKVGVLGFSMGGRVAYLMAARNPTLAAAVVFYGGIMRAWGEGPSPFELTAEIACPLLGLYAELDPNPSPEDVRRIEAALTRYGKVHECLSYAGVGHGFLVEGRSSYHAAAAADGWERAVAWLKKYLSE
jgi:carboxymethylenebutenolidase